MQFSHFAHAKIYTRSYDSHGGGNTGGPSPSSPGEVLCTPLLHSQEQKRTGQVLLEPLSCFGCLSGPLFYRPVDYASHRVTFHHSSQLLCRKVANPFPKRWPHTSPGRWHTSFDKVLASPFKMARHASNSRPSLTPHWWNLTTSLLSPQQGLLITRCGGRCYWHWMLSLLSCTRFEKSYVARGGRFITIQNANILIMKTIHICWTLWTCRNWDDHTSATWCSQVCHIDFTLLEMFDLYYAPSWRDLFIGSHSLQFRQIALVVALTSMQQGMSAMSLS